MRDQYEDRPSPLACIQKGLEHALYATVSVVILVVALLATHQSAEDAVAVVQVGFWGLAAGVCCTLLARPYGVGTLAPVVFSPIFLQASVAALKAGGGPLLGGMTLFAGACALVVGFAGRWVPYLFPPLLITITVLVVGIEMGLLSIEAIFNLTQKQAMSPDLWASLGGVVAFLVATVLAFHQRLKLQRLAPLLGLVAGLLLSLAGSMPAYERWFHEGQTAFLAWPTTWSFPHTFQVGLILPFLTASLGGALYSSGVAVHAGRSSSATLQLAQGMLQPLALRIDGLANCIGGFLGLAGVSQEPRTTQLLSTGYRATTALVAAGALVVFGCSPYLADLFVRVPLPVVGGVLGYFGLRLLVDGFQQLLETPLDRNRGIVLASSIFAGVLTIFLTANGRELPAWLSPLFGNMLTAALVVGLLGHWILKIRPTYTISGEVDSEHFSSTENQIKLLLEKWNADSSVQEALIHDLGLLPDALRSCEAQTPHYEIWTDCNSLRLTLYYTGKDLDNRSWYADHVAMNHPGKRVQVTMTYRK